MKKLTITFLQGDGVGPELIDAAKKVLTAIEHRFGIDFFYNDMLIGGAAIDKTGVPLPDETLAACRESDAVLLGAVGGPKWDALSGHLRPEKGLLSLRSALELYANVRPIVMYNELAANSPLSEQLTKKGVNIMLVREIGGGIYTGERGYRDGAYGQEAYDTERYSISEIERIAKLAFEIAKTRNKKIVSVDKANVLETSRLWRATVSLIGSSYPDVKLEHMLAEDCAAQLAKDPSQFDVILTSNLFGEILSNQAAALTGAIGMLPSSSLGLGKVGLYSPIHGPQTELAGKDAANPVGILLSAAMMLGQSLDLVEEGAAIEAAIRKALARGFRTPDIAVGKKITALSCSKMADEIVNIILEKK